MSTMKTLFRVEERDESEKESGKIRFQQFHNAMAG
jgi:hypothetical protein